MKNSFIVQTRLNAIVAKLSDKQAGALFKSILNYAENGAIGSFEDNAVSIVFEFARQDIDYAAQKYAETCARRAESGRAGGKAKSNKSKQMLANQANASKCLNEQANASKSKHIDIDNDIEQSINTLPKEKEIKEKEKLDFAELPLGKVLRRWIDYRKQIKKPLKSSMSVEECYKKLDKLSGGDITTAEKIINQSIAQGWQGLFELKGEQQNAGTDYNRNPEPNKYAGFGRTIGADTNA